jgi:hypothetical protein
VTGTFSLFEEGSNIVIGQPGGRTTHGSRLDFEWFSLLYRGTLGEGHSKSFVYNRFEWTAGPPRFSLEASGNIVIQRKRSSHTS